MAPYVISFFCFFLFLAWLAQRLNGSKTSYTTFEVAGVQFENSDGRNRQDLLQQMTEDTAIMAVHDARNTHDKNAVKILAEIEGKFQQIGFIPKQYSSEVCAWLKARKVIACEIAELFEDDEHLKAEVGIEVKA